MISTFLSFFYFFNFEQILYQSGPYSIGYNPLYVLVFLTYIIDIIWIYNLSTGLYHLTTPLTKSSLRSNLGFTTALYIFTNSITTLMGVIVILNQNIPILISFSFPLVILGYATLAALLLLFYRFSYLGYLTPTGQLQCTTCQKTFTELALHKQTNGNLLCNNCHYQKLTPTSKKTTKPKTTSPNLTKQNGEQELEERIKRKYYT
jgi:hypothetical protein